MSALELDLQGTGRPLVIIVAPACGSDGRFLALAGALEELDEKWHDGSYDAVRAALLEELARCPIDSEAGLRWASRDLREILEIEAVSERAVLLSRKIEQYIHR